jgi:hypothetical protein
MRHLVFLLGTLSATSAAADDCDIRNFQSRSFGDTASYQALAYAEKITQEHYNQIQAGGGGDVAFAGIELGGDYNEFRENIEIFRSNISLSTYNSYAETFYTTALSRNGLDAYITCIGNGGVELVASYLADGTPAVSIISRPSPGQSFQQPKITDSSNIANLASLSATISAATFGSGAVQLERNRLQPSSLDEPLSVTISFGNVSDTVAFPPQTLPPPPQITLSAPPIEAALMTPFLNCLAARTGAHPNPAGARTECCEILGARQSEDEFCRSGTNDQERRTTLYRVCVGLGVARCPDHLAHEDFQVLGLPTP